MQNSWIPITSVEDILLLQERSRQVPCLILKHSTRCEISAIAKYRLEDDLDLNHDQLETYCLDLIRYRAVSDFIADTFHIHHESPQVLLIINEECVYDASHLDITVSELKESLAVMPNH